MCQFVALFKTSLGHASILKRVLSNAVFIMWLDHCCGCAMVPNAMKDTEGHLEMSAMSPSSVFFAQSLSDCKAVYRIEVGYTVCSAMALCRVRPTSNDEHCYNTCTLTRFKTIKVV